MAIPCLPWRSLGLTSRTIAALLAAALAWGASAAGAEQPSQQELQRQLEELRAQVNELKAARATPAYTDCDVDAAVESVVRDADRRSRLMAETGGFYGGWMDDKFTIRSADGAYSLSPSIGLQFRSVTNFNQNGNGGKDNTDNGFEVRRLKIGFDGNAISKNLYYNFVWATDRTTGNLVNEEAYVQYKFADHFTVKAGQYKEYIYHEQTVSYRRLLAVDRSLLNEVINGGESYVQGVDLMWDNDRGLRADAGFTDGYNSRNTNFQDPVGSVNPFDFGVHGRVEYAVFGGFKGYNQFTSLGLKDSLLVVGAGGDWSQGNALNVYHHNVDAQWNAGKVGVYAAFLGLYSDLAGGGSSYDYGFLVQANYLLTDRLELFGRYDYIHLDGSGSAIAHGAEDTFHEVTVGVNYYLHGHSAKVTLDAGWLPSGSPANQTGIGVLANDGDNQFYLRAQFQLLI